MHVCSILPLNGDKIALTLLTRTTCRAMMKVLYFLLGGRPIGRTPDSGSGYPGSSPGLPANSYFQQLTCLTATVRLRFSRFSVLCSSK